MNTLLIIAILAILCAVILTILFRMAEDNGPDYDEPRIEIHPGDGKPPYIIPIVKIEHIQAVNLSTWLRSKGICPNGSFDERKEIQHIKDVIKRIDES